MLMVLGVICLIASAICGIIILIDAFSNELWKGALCLVCSLYGLYYALVEYEGDNKLLVVGTSLIGGVVGWVLIGMANPGRGVGVP